MNMRAGKTGICVIAALGMMSSAAMAAHANPWADPEDVVQSQYHEDNQARSIDTPGEDEMKGVMTRNAHGKLGTAGGNAQGGQGQGSGNGKGGGGNGGGGNGGGGNGGGKGRN